MKVLVLPKNEVKQPHKTVREQKKKKENKKERKRTKKDEKKEKREGESINIRTPKCYLRRLFFFGIRSVYKL